MKINFEILYYGIIIIAFGIISFVLSKRNRDYRKNGFLNRIVKDEDYFITYIVLIVIGVPMLLFFKEHTQTIIDETFSFVLLYSISQYGNLKKYAKPTEDDIYYRVATAIEYFFIFGWGIRIIGDTMFENKSIYVNAFFMVATVIMSLWGLKELQQVKNKYINNNQDF